MKLYISLLFTVLSSFAYSQYNMDIHRGGHHFKGCYTLSKQVITEPNQFICFIPDSSSVNFSLKIARWEEKRESEATCDSYKASAITTENYIIKSLSGSVIGEASLVLGANRYGSITIDNNKQHFKDLYYRLNRQDINFVAYDTCRE